MSCTLTRINGENKYVFFKMPKEVAFFTLKLQLSLAWWHKNDRIANFINEIICHNNCESLGHWFFLWARTSNFLPCRVV